MGPEWTGCFETSAHAEGRKAEDKEGRRRSRMGMGKDEGRQGLGFGYLTPNAEN